MNSLLPAFPTRSFDRLSQMMEETFSPLWDSDRWNMAPWMPPVDISETEKEYRFVVETPGFLRDNVEVEMANDVLTIRGKREETKEDKEAGSYVRRERRFGEFRRCFKLDSHVRPESVVAEFKDGILTVIVPKVEAVKPHKVEVRG